MKCILMGGEPYVTQLVDSGYGIFEGWTNEDGSSTLVEESCPLSEFDVMIGDTAVNDLTYLELVALL